MSRYRHRLPQLDADLFLADGGLETTLVFTDGFELPDFAAFPLLADADGRRALDAYYDAYAAIAVRDRVGIVLDTPTWRANPDWAARLGYDVEALDTVEPDAVAPAGRGACPARDSRHPGRDQRRDRSAR